MVKIEYSIVETIELELNQYSSPGIITIYNNTGAQNTMPGTTTLTVNSFIKNLRAYAEIKSLAPVRLPSFALEDSESDKTYKMLDVEWGSPRKQLDLFISKNGGNWKKMGAISLLNPSGYPYRIYNLQDLYTPNLAIELGKNGKIGCQIVDVGYGVLANSDFITIHGSFTEEIVAYEGSEYTACSSLNWSITSESQIILPANPDRGRIALVNSGNSPVYITLGNVAELGKGILLSAQGSSFEMDTSSGIWKGNISAVCETTETLTGTECVY